MDGMNVGFNKVTAGYVEKTQNIPQNKITSPISFKNVETNLSKTTLTSQTMAGLIGLDGCSFPEYMINDLLATPYVSVDYKS